MGLRFSLQNANSVGHFTDGNIFSFLRDFSLLRDQSEGSIEFLENLILNPGRDFFTSPVYWRGIRSEFDYLRNNWGETKEKLYRLRSLDGEDQGQYDKELLRYLSIISGLLARCRIKTLLLPGFNDSKLDRVMGDSEFLQTLIRIHPGDSALILQLKERILKERSSILNVFSKFGTAYNNIDLWPGVLLWNQRESVFVPVQEDTDVINIYELLSYERYPFRYLKDLAAKRKDRVKYAYLFHLSDLHFGCPTSNQRKLRLSTILRKHLTELGEPQLALPIVTGDLMDTPSNSNKNGYLEFCELLKGNGFNNPIQLLGNHDVDSGGIFKRQSGQKAIISALAGQSSLEILKDIGLGFIKFNSNTGGQLAQGMIGGDQMMHVGNEMDALQDGDKLSYIALVHHHPKQIDNPDWYQNNWIENLLGKISFEKAMRMVDADKFLAWIESRNIKLILHGHKHIPIVHAHNDVTIIAAGSATGKVKHIDKGKTYLSYNLIKYDIDQRKPVSCTILAEEILGGGTKNVLLHGF